MTEAIDFLLTRRSVSARLLKEPGPDAQSLALILKAGTRVPDHGKLEPWRIILFEGEERARFGAFLGRVWRLRKPEATAAQLEIEESRFLRAPVVLAVISSIRAESHIPEWEQILSAGALCQTILIAAASLGYAAQWVTEWYAYDPEIGSVLGLRQGERVAGFIFLGDSDEKPEDRKRPDLDVIVTSWKAAQVEI